MATNLEAAQSGDRLAALRVLRDTLALQLDTTDAQIHAQLAAQYSKAIETISELEVLEEIDGGVADGEDADDEAWEPG